MTRTKLRLLPEPEEKVTILFGFDNIQEAISLTEDCVTSNSEIVACELFFQNGVNLVREAYGVQPLWENKHSTYLLCEFAGDHNISDRLSEGVLGKILQTHNSVLVATTDGER